MIARTQKRDLKDRLDRLTHEIVQLKASLVYQARPETPQGLRAWRDLMKAADEVSASWSGMSAVDEIRNQRAA